jgi:serine/threonine protein kinase
MPSPMAHQSARIIGRYVLYADIAHGGMATLHIGRLLGPVGFSRTVAIKRLHPQFARDPEFVSMFLDEARLAARIQHQNVVPVIDVVALEGELFLVMDYVQGESLAKLLSLARKAGQAVPTSIAVSLVVGVLHGLHAAHEARTERGVPLNIVHRDISPQNILVGVDGVARVVDFGIAKAAGRLQTTRDGQLKGKLSYMAPEQIGNWPVDRRTDVYAASVVLWETLAGRRLFHAEEAAAVMGLVLRGEVEPLGGYNGDVSVALDEIIRRGLAANPEHRWRTARELALALEQAVVPATAAQVGEWLERLAARILTEKRADLRCWPRACLNSKP